MARTRRTDAGLTMIELIIVVILVGILGIVTATILANSWRAQNDVTTTTEATNEGQLVGQAIERAVRNAVCIDAPTSNQLRVRTVYPAGDNRAYQSFWVAPDPADASKSDLYMASSGSSSLPAAGPWAEGVAHTSGSSQYFTVSADGQTATYAINLITAAAPVTISGSVALRVSGGSAPCW